MLWLLLTTAQAVEPITFHPNAGPELLEIGPDSTIDGVPVRVPGTVLVRTDDPDALAQMDGVASIRPLRAGGGVYEVVPQPGHGVGRLSRRMHERGDVRWAHPDLEFPLQTHYLPNDPYLHDQWHLLNVGQRNYTPGVDVNAQEAWDLVSGEGQLVAVIDDGVDVDHQDLRVIDGFNYVEEIPTSDSIGDDGHGTAVAGLIGAIGDNNEGTVGVAYGAEIYGIRLLGGYTSLSATYNAFVESIDAGAAVLNNSWGFDNGCSDITLYATLEDAIDYAEENGRDGKGSVVVFSAGNGNCDITADGLQSHPAVVSTAAIDGYGIKEDYSSFGPWVDITAPSSRIATTDILGPNGYGSMHNNNDYDNNFGGTSATAPQISGVFALMFSANKRLTAQEARDALCATAVRIDLGNGQWDESGWSPIHGCGRVDAGAAVRAVYNEGAPDAPELLGPEDVDDGEPVILEWTEPADPDDDRLSYKVRWWLPDFPEFGEENVDADRPWVELQHDQFQPGLRIAWKVRASDPYGSGPWSNETTFTILKPVTTAQKADDEPGGCDTGGTAGGWLWLALLPLLGRRRD